jgi:hypothetical protein
VKLATHLLTGEKVAIKVIDKRAIGVCVFFWSCGNQINNTCIFMITDQV